MKECYFCKNNIKLIDYKNTELLRGYLSAQGKIAPRKRSGSCAKHQRAVAHAVKRSRVVGLLPYTSL